MGSRAKPRSRANRAASRKSLSVRSNSLAASPRPAKRAMRLGHGNGSGVGQTDDALRSNEQDDATGLTCVADRAFGPTDRDHQFGERFRLLFTLECMALADQDIGWRSLPHQSRHSEKRHWAIVRHCQATAKVRLHAICAASPRVLRRAPLW